MKLLPLEPLQGYDWPAPKPSRPRIEVYAEAAYVLQRPDGTLVTNAEWGQEHAARVWDFMGWCPPDEAGEDADGWVFRPCVPYF